MVEITGFDHDVFVSYAHVDDQAVCAGGTGWVSNLVQRIRCLLSSKLGRSDVRIWFDQSGLRGNQIVTPEIRERVRRSACFLCIVSPGYSNSKWCRDELAAFTSRGVTERRVFAVEIDTQFPFRESLPALGELRGYQFGYMDTDGTARCLGLPNPDADVGYFKRVQDITADIATCLQRHIPSLMSLQPAAAVASPSAAGPASAPLSQAVAASPPSSLEPAARGTVFVAEVTDDLDDQRDQICRYLVESGCRVLPDRAYPSSGEAFQAEMERDLAGVDLFVQLLSHRSGRTSTDVPFGYPRLQHDIAERLGKLKLLWRSPELSGERIVASLNRELLESEALHATPIHAFQRAILSALVRPEPEEEEPEVPSALPVVYITAERDDVQIAMDIQDAIDSRAITVLPCHQGPARVIREHHEQNLIECDQLVIIYGAENLNWVEQQARQLNRLAPRRARTARTAIFDAPPTDKADLTLRMPNLFVFRSRDRADCERIREFVGRILAAAGQDAR